jgi:long-chain acyl-CoA synthetase
MSFKIIDRRKNIFKLQQGEYLAPDRIENKYLKSKLISEIFLHGDSQQSFAVAIIALNRDELQVLAQSKGIKGSHSDLCANPQIRKLILTDINELGRREGLNGFELAKNVYL